jgi:hypothetical protein
MGSSNLPHLHQSNCGVAQSVESGFIRQGVVGAIPTSATNNPDQDHLRQFSTFAGVLLPIGSYPEIPAY